MRLVEATPAMVDAELEGRLAEALGASLAPDWPPEFHDEKTLRFTRDALARPGAEGWWLHYILHEDVAAGVCGFKGPPADGVAEIGYSVVPSMQRRGLATDRAFAVRGPA